MRKIIIFDFDGVIVDTFPLSYAIEFKRNGKSPEDFKDMYMGNIFDSLTENPDSLQFKKQSEIYFSYYTPGLLNLSPVFGIEALIKKLKEGYLLTIVSSTPTEPIEKFLEFHGLKEHFEDILGSDIHRSKAEKISMVLEKHTVSSKNSIFITDTVGDLIEASKKDVPTLVVTWGFHEKSRFNNHKPIDFVNSAEEISEAIENHFSKI